jgi:hypothetical protein
VKLPPDLEAKCLELAGVKPAAKPARGKVELVAAAHPEPNVWVIPLHLAPVTNNGAIKRSAIGRAAKDRRATANALAAHLGDLAPWAKAAQARWPVACRIVRLGGGLMDDDNLPVTAKWVRDTIALFLGVGDGPRGPVRWEYGQEPGGKVGVRVELSVEGGR